VGVAYQLVNQDSGKVVRNLVTNDRLKRYNVDRDDFNRRLPSLQQVPNTERLVDLPQDNNIPVDPTPVEIMSDKIVRGKRYYDVLFSEGKTYCCDWVSRLLRDNYQSKLRSQSGFQQPCKSVRRCRKYIRRVRAYWLCSMTLNNGCYLFWPFGLKLVLGPTFGL